MFTGGSSVSEEEAGIDTPAQALCGPCPEEALNYTGLPCPWSLAGSHR